MNLKSPYVENNCNYPVAVQFNDEILDIVTLLFCGIEGLVCHLEGVVLNEREAFWIFTFQTWCPGGVNDELLLNVML